MLAPASVNPARAGMILVPLQSLKPDLCKPRASGDDPEVGVHDADRVG